MRATALHAQNLQQNQTLPVRRLAGWRVYLQMTEVTGTHLRGFVATAYGLHR